VREFAVVGGGLDRVSGGDWPQKGAKMRGRKRGNMKELEGSTESILHRWDLENPDLRAYGRHGIHGR